MLENGFISFESKLDFFAQERLFATGIPEAVGIDIHLIFLAFFKPVKGYADCIGHIVKIKFAPYR